MKVTYRKLFKLMEDKYIKKVYLRSVGISPTVVSRLVHDQNVNTSTIVKLCQILKCQPGDIMEVIPE